MSLYQDIDGQRIYSVGAAWFKVSRNSTEESVNSRLSLCAKHAENDPVLFQIFKTLLSEGSYKTFNRHEARLLGQKVKALKEEWIFNGRI